MSTASGLPSAFAEAWRAASRYGLARSVWFKGGMALLALLVLTTVGGLLAGLLEASSWNPSVQWAGLLGRVQPALGCGLVLVLWSGLVSGVRAQNGPALARLLPAQVSALRGVLGAGLTVLALAGTWPLAEISGLPLLQCALQAVLVLSLGLVMTRWLLLWLLPLALLLIAVLAHLLWPEVAGRGWQALALLWREPPGSAHAAGVFGWLLAVPALAAWGVWRAVQTGDASHRRLHAMWTLNRRADGRATWRPRADLEPVRQWQQGLPPPLQWRALRLLLWVNAPLIVLGAGLLAWRPDWSGGLAGFMVFGGLYAGLCTSSLTHLGFEWPRAVGSVGAELNLVRLLPGGPQGAMALEAALQRRRAAQAGVLTLVVAVLSALSLLRLSEGPQNVLWMAVMGAGMLLPWLLALQRLLPRAGRPIRRPGWQSAGLLILPMLLGAAFLLIQSRDDMPLIATATLLSNAALAALWWRWRRR